MTSLGPKIRIFGDGSSLGNPGPGGWGVIVEDGRRVIEKGGRSSHATNNQMELQAI
jgi:Ribonuclease HI